MSAELHEEPAFVDGGQDDGEQGLADDTDSHQDQHQVPLLDDRSHPRFALDVLETQRLPLKNIIKTSIH